MYSYKYIWIIWNKIIYICIYNMEMQLSKFHLDVILLSPMIHPTIVGVFEWTRYFQPTMWEIRGLPLGEIS